MASRRHQRLALATAADLLTLTTAAGRRARRSRREVFVHEVGRVDSVVREPRPDVAQGSAAQGGAEAAQEIHEAARFRGRARQQVSWVGGAHAALPRLRPR
ncbi:hypothetical protein SCALM49S_03444 [Streptomyces californicus]